MLTSLVVALIAAQPAPTCTLRGVVADLDQVAFEALDAPHDVLFVATLHGARVAATLTSDATRVAIDGDAGLKLRAQVARERLPVRVRQRTRLGPLTLSTRTPLVALRVTADGVELVARPNDEVTLGPFVLACDQLTLGDAAPNERAIVVRGSEHRRLAAVPDALDVRARFDPASPAIHVSLVAGAAFLLERIATRGTRVQVQTRWTDGTRLMGWVEDNHVMPMQLDYADQLGALGGICGFGVSRTYLGPAIMKPGARILDRDRGRVWAIATKTTTVEVLGDSGLVELTALPGVVMWAGCARTERAWVDSASLVYPSR